MNTTWTQGMAKVEVVQNVSISFKRDAGANEDRLDSSNGCPGML